MPDCLYIGIDFGTTFSGAAWAFSRQPENIKIVTKWRADRAFNTDDAKTPTEIVYGHGKSNRNVVSWGYEISANQTPLKWFKLCLVDSKDLHPDVQRSEQLKAAYDMLSAKGITAIDAAADYLRQLWKYTIESIEREFGAQPVRGLPFRVIVTVPAMWKPNAMERTREAAKRAGILESRLCGKTTLDLIPEPEAAALATLAEFQGRPGVIAGDVITVCDCGGGTVDITSYKIQRSDPVVVKECVEGDGKMCGAIFVDQAFESFLRGRILKRRWDKLTPEQIKKVMNDEWEHGIKRGFRDEEREWDVRLPAEATGTSILHRPKTSGLKLSRNHVSSIFNPILGQIRGLINKQVQEIRRKEGKPPKCIMLVGGFGRCSYLFQVVRKEFASQETEILQSSGNEPWTAICRGAVIKAMSAGGLEGAGGVTVTTRVSKRNYGIACYEPFRQDYHLPTDRKYIDAEGGYFATNQMRWYLRKGVDIATQNPVRMGFYKLCEFSWEIQNNEFCSAIYASETDSAPNRKTNDVSKLCDIRIRLDTPFEMLPIYINNFGQQYRKVEYDIEMTCSGALLKFSAIINGIRQPEQNVEASFL